ncbi:MANSC domain-containing protein 1-like [Anguilla anguilla]|uniref:MANSC domain-containing protein 1-like n=1 Tax=Anguilla anguilla TaxID=7936 RepID=UPI0015A93107|nr:MANSC domain-containing protein 1-like [Anguilla anguilla]
MNRIALMPFLLLTMMLLLWGAVSVISAQGQQLCFSKQHQEKTINVRVALSKKTTIMHAVCHPSELDCLKACCSTDPKDLNCNIAIFKPGKLQGTENCYLFHCKRDEDCPLMTMNGVNTYNIFKGLEIINAVSTATNRTTAATTTTHSTTTPASITLLTPTTTTTRPSISTSTPTTTKASTCTATVVIARKPHQPTEKPPIDPNIALQVTPITNTVSTTATKIFTPPIFISIAQSAHPRTDHVYPDSLTPLAGRDTNNLGAVKYSLVAAVAVGLVCLTCFVALVGRKAAESFNHRQYTRLELNNLKYDI